VAFHGHHPVRPGQVEVVPAVEDRVLEDGPFEPGAFQKVGHPASERTARRRLPVTLEEQTPERRNAAAPPHVVKQQAAPQLVPLDQLLAPSLVQQEQVLTGIVDDRAAIKERTGNPCDRYELANSPVHQLKRLALVELHADPGPWPLMAGHGDVNDSRHTLGYPLQVRRTPVRDDSRTVGRQDRCSCPHLP
jgi:hypothetical protein